jgi:hypothetical protein
MTDKRTQARLEKQLVAIRERPENQKCMDCKEMVRERMVVVRAVVHVISVSQDVQRDTQHSGLRELCKHTVWP